MDANKNKPKIVLAVQNSASSDEFLNKLKTGEHLMVVADEVHNLGSEDFQNSINPLWSKAWFRTLMRDSMILMAQTKFFHILETTESVIELKDV